MNDCSHFWWLIKWKLKTQERRKEDLLRLWLCSCCCYRCCHLLKAARATNYSTYHTWLFFIFVTHISSCFSFFFSFFSHPYRATESFWWQQYFFLVLCLALFIHLSYFIVTVSCIIFPRYSTKPNSLVAKQHLMRCLLLLTIRLQIKKS